MSLSNILGRLEKVRQSGGSYTALCPAHADRHASLSIREEKDRILIHCHRGCTIDLIARALNCEVRDFFIDDESSAKYLRQQKTSKISKRRLVLVLEEETRKAREREAKIVGDDLPIRTRHRQKAWDVLTRRLKLPPVRLVPKWYEVPPNDVDPLWEIFCERALANVTNCFSDVVEATAEQYDQALDVAAAWLHEFARQNMERFA